MSASSLDDTAMTSSSSVTSDVNQVLRLTGAKPNSRYFGFPWKQQNKDDKSITKNESDNDVAPDNSPNSKLSNGFLKNIKKRLRLKSISLCKAKQKIKALDVQCPVDEVSTEVSTPEDRPLSFAENRNPIGSNSRLVSCDLDASLSNEGDDILQSAEADACWESYLALAEKSEAEKAPSRNTEADRDLRLERVEENDFPNQGEIQEEASIVRAGNIAEPQSTTARESVQAPDSIDAQLSTDCKAKVNLSEELLKLSKYGWYWGPISGDEADSKLVSEPDGAFLVRDSSDDRYLLTLSFKSSGRLLHARMEHSGGLFSLCNQGENEGFTSVPALILHSMNSSQSAVFCYSRPRYPGYPSFPVRLTKPVSRFTQVRSLQYLCRFVIRQNTRLDNIHKLPLPKTIRGYIEEAHY